MADYLESEKVRERWLRYLESGHKEPAERMMATYRRSLRQIEAEVKPLIRRLAAAERAADAVEAQALTTRLSLAYSRAESVRGAITGIVERSGLAGVTDEQIRKLAPKAFAQGAALGYDRLQGTGVQFQRINERAVEQAIGRLRRGTNADEWVKSFAGEQGKEASRSLARSVALGHGVDRMTRDFSQSVSRVARHRIETFVRTEMIGAMRDGNLAAYQANPGVVEGWVWNATGTACAVCQGMNGSVHPLTERMYSHPRCRCSMDPITKPFDELGVTGLTETRSAGFDPNPRFALLKESEQRRILGSGRFRRYREGRLDIRDVPARTRHPKWGPGLRSKTLKELDSGGGERVPVSPAGPTPPPAPAPPVVDTAPPPVPTNVSLPWLDELEAIRSRREGYGLNDELYGNYTSERSRHIKETVDERDARLGRARAAFMDDLDAQVDDVLEAGRVFEEEVARRLAARGVRPLEEAIENRRRRVRRHEEEIAHLESLGRVRGKKQALREARINLREAQGGLEAALEGPHKEVRHVVREMLSEIRETGFTNQQRSRLLDIAERGADKQALESVDRMAEYLPREWLDEMLKFMEGRAERVGKMQFKRVQRGEFYEGSMARRPHLNTSPYSTANSLADEAGAASGVYDSTTLHEMTHWAEAALEELKALEWSYYMRRTTVNGAREAKAKLSTFFPGRGYGAHEVAREDKFASVYMGKDYGDSPTSFYEVATMGIESAMRTTSGPSIDGDHKRFIYGLLALLRRAA